MEDYDVIEIPINTIHLGIPKFNWLINRISTDEFIRQAPDVYQSLMREYGSKKKLVRSLIEQYDTLTDLPVLVELYDESPWNTVASNYRFNLRDGYRRLTTLFNQGVTVVDAVIWQDGWGKAEWEASYLWDLMIQKIKNGLKVCPRLPQKKYIHGQFPYDAYLKGRPAYPKRVEIDSYMVSTGILVPYVLKKGDSLECRGDRFNLKNWNRMIEILFGHGKHEKIMDQWGTQPLNSYVCGHFSKPNDYVMVQQYFRAGNWGLDVEGFKHNGGVPIIRQQIEQNNIAVPLMYSCGYLMDDTRIYYADQSADKPCPMSQYFRLFSGRDSLRKYYKWLPTYLETCRWNHFNIPIEEVIEWIPNG